MSKKEISFTQMLAVPVGTEEKPGWVDDFLAYVSVGAPYEPRNGGRTSWTLTIQNPTGPETTQVKVWQRPGDDWDGKLCRFTGPMLKKEYKGKVELSLTPMARIYVVTGDQRPPASSPSSAQPMPAPRPPTQNPGNGQSPASVGPSIGQMGSLWRECWQEAMNITTQISVPDAWKAEDVRALATTLFIEANKKGIQPTTTRPLAMPAPASARYQSPAQDSDESRVPFNFHDL